MGPILQEFGRDIRVQNSWIDIISGKSLTTCTGDFLAGELKRKHKGFEKFKNCDSPNDIAFFISGIVKCNCLLNKFPKNQLRQQYFVNTSNMFKWKKLFLLSQIIGIKYKENGFQC